MVEKLRPQNAEISRDELAYRLHQQTVTSAFGRLALGCRELDPLLQRATEMCADGMDAEFCKVLEYRREENVFLVRAGHGWAADVVGQAIFGGDLASPAGYALHTGKPVISNELESETRFRTPPLLVQHGVRRAINVIIGGADAPFGVLEVDSSSTGRFEAADLAFMDGFANLIGVVIDRHGEHVSAQEHQINLIREMSHRIKNSLATVTGFLALQARETGDRKVREALHDAENRVRTVAQIHDQLWRQKDLEHTVLPDFLGSLGAKLQDMSHAHTLVLEVEQIEIPTEKAVPLALLVNELVTNAVKHAYPGAGGQVWVTVSRLDDRVILDVSDRGVGLPPRFDPLRPGGSLGMKVIQGLARQLGGELAFRSNQPGARFTVTFPG